MRAILFGEDAALAGEDDDEGHPWAVVTDAPALLVGLLGAGELRFEP